MAALQNPALGLLTPEQQDLFGRLHRQLSAERRRKATREDGLDDADTGTARMLCPSRSTRWTSATLRAVITDPDRVLLPVMLVIQGTRDSHGSHLQCRARVDCSPCLESTSLFTGWGLRFAEGEDGADDRATSRPESAASSKPVARQAAARSKPSKPSKKPARLPPEFKDLSSWCVRAAR